jgi:predicted RNase H-like nuclease (RuvC/YqgF family)
MRVTERFIAFAIGVALGALACFALLMAMADNRSADQRAELQTLQSQVTDGDNDLQSRKKVADAEAANLRQRITALQKSLGESEAKNDELKNERDAFEARLAQVEAELRAKTIGPDAAQLTRFNRAEAKGARELLSDIELADGRFRFTDLELSKTDVGCLLSGQIVSSKDELEPVAFHVTFYDEKDEQIDSEFFTADLPIARQQKAFEKQFTDAPGRNVSHAFRFKISFDPE